jgi:hypothetical protein
MPDWRWSDAAHNYRNLDTGRWVSGAQVRSWSAAASKASGEAVTSMADMLADGRLNVRDWTLLMRDELKDVYIQQYVLARGGLEQMTQRDWGTLGPILREQYQYLDRFAREVADGTVSEAQIRRRAAMYVRSSREAFERGNARMLGVVGLPDYPGAGNTLCRANCLCFWEIKPVKEAGKVVRWECYWRLRPAEHCTSEEVDAQGRPLGCVQRAELWNPYIIDVS